MLYWKSDLEQTKEMFEDLLSGGWGSFKSKRMFFGINMSPLRI